MSKYGAIRTEYGGQVYDSRGEAEHARRLDLLKAAGAIRDWRRGTAWVLVDAPRRADRITYTPDYHVWAADGGFYVLDFKGVETAVFKLKARLWKAVYPSVPLHVVRADGTERRV